MSNKDKNNTKKADFIDLDKSQFKKKLGSWVKVSISLGAVVALLLFLIFKRDIYVPSSKKNPMESVKDNLIKEDTIFIENTKIKINEDLQDQILKIEKQLQIKIEDKSVILEKKISELKDELNILRKNQQNLGNSNNDKKFEKKFEILAEEIDSIKRMEDHKFFFNIFKKAVLSSKSYEYEYDLILKVFSEEDEITNRILFFESHKTKGIKNHSLLLKEINEYLGVKNELKEANGKEININKSVESLSDYKQFLIDEVKSIIKIKKVNPQNTLDSYRYEDSESMDTFKTIILKAKEYLLIKDLNTAINMIESIKSPAPVKIEEWISDAKQFLKTEIKILDLEETINEISFK